MLADSNPDKRQLSEPEASSRRSAAAPAQSSGATRSGSLSRPADSNPDKRPDTAADIVRKAIEQAGWAVEYWYGREKADAYVREALAALDTLVAE